MEFYSKLLLTLFSRFEINTIRKYTFPSLFLIKLNSSSLEPTDEPFKSPDPLNFNSEPFWLIYHIVFLIVGHYNHHYSIDSLRNNLVR